MDYNDCKIAGLRNFYLFYFQSICVDNLCIGTREIETFRLVSDSNCIVVDHYMHELKSQVARIGGNGFACAQSNLFLRQ